MLRKDGTVVLPARNFRSGGDFVLTDDNVSVVDWIFSRGERSDVGGSRMDEFIANSWGVLDLNG